MPDKQKVIYCRYSSEMQRAESCADQERDVRAALPRKGIDPSDAVVIRDEAESGTKTEREGFRELSVMVARGQVALLAVDDQSRLTRGADAFAFITDLVYRGGRFISTGEDIDTDVPGWELKVQVLQLHHGQVVRDLQHRVRRGQLGRVLADGSAGDFPFGYTSYYLADDWAEQLARRGPKPTKGLRVCEDEARWVRQIFDWFTAARSIGWIARELTRLQVPKGRRASTLGWHPQQVRRMLGNEKYVGRWLWGATTTRRDSQGRKKQIDAPPDQVFPRDRPNLRIVPQEVWDRAARRLDELGVAFGYRDGQKRRGPRPNPAEVYPRSPLGGLLTCGKCGAKLWQRHSNSRRYYTCPGATSGQCDVTAQVPADRAERALSEFLLGLLRGWPEWMRTVYRSTCDAVRAAAARVPADQEQDARRAGELGRQIDHLVTAMAEGGLTSPAVAARLQELEREQVELDARLARSASFDPTRVVLPDEVWVADRLTEWADRVAADAGPSSLVRAALESLRAEPVLAPGKKRGFVRLFFRVRAWNILTAALGDHLPAHLADLVPTPGTGNDGGPEFTVDLGAPTPADRWGAQIVVWRAEGVTWKEIARRTSLDLNRVYRAWKRFLEASPDTPPAS